MGSVEPGLPGHAPCSGAVSLCSLLLLGRLPGMGQLSLTLLSTSQLGITIRPSACLAWGWAWRGPQRPVQRPTCHRRCPCLRGPGPRGHLVTNSEAQETLPRITPPLIQREWVLRGRARCKVPAWLRSVPTGACAQSLSTASRSTAGKEAPGRAQMPPALGPQS